MSASCPEPDYTSGERYWSTVESSVDGMLGGLPFLHDADVRDSRRSLLPYVNSGALRTDRALDCGAGIGRVSKHLLLPIFSRVDLVEQSEQFLADSKPYLAAEAPKVGERFASALQDFTPEANRYDLIWIQWVIGHLTDSDLSAFLRRCVDGLRPYPGSLIVVKDNVARSSSRDFDAVDASVMRPRNDLLAVFESAQLAVVKEAEQTDFPVDICQVRIFALRPK